MALVNQPTNLIDRIKELERKVAELSVKTGLGNAVISRGDLTVRGGSIRLENGNGVELANLGNITYGGVPQRGFWLRRGDGSVAFSVAGHDEQQFVAIWDRNAGGGYPVVSDDAASGYGLATPYIPIPLYPQTGLHDNGAAKTTSDTFVSLWSGRYFVQHPKLYFEYATTASGTSGTQEYRVMVGGVQVHGSTGVTYESGLVSIPGWGTTIKPFSLVEVAIQARATGDSTAYVWPRCFYGHRS